MNTNTPLRTADPEQTVPASAQADLPETLEWSAPSVPHHERSSQWYAVGSVLVLAIAVYGILTGAWTMTVLSLLIGGVYFLSRRTPPALKRVRLTEQGLFLNDRFARWSDCKEFWLIGTPEYVEFHVVQKRGHFQTELIVQTGDIDPTEIAAYVSRYLPMRSDQKEKLLDVIIRLCKL